MRVLSKDMKRGEVKVRVEIPEDLWHLECVIKPGDFVTSKTMRKVSVKKAGEYEYGEKRPMVLTVRVEKVEFQEDSGILRITGPVVSGPEDIRKHSYHSFSLDTGSVLTIRKEKWKSFEIRRLEEARFRKPSVLVCVLDREEADFAVLKESGIRMRARITNYDRERMEEYYKQIVSYIRKQEFEILVLAGPGFERENLLKFIGKNDKDLAKKVILEHSSSTGLNGVQEVVKKSANRILRETRIAKESGYVNEILKRIKTGGLVVYGKGETEKAVRMGAVEILFVSQGKIREFEGVMEEQERMGGEVVVIGGDHESGEQFLHLGGIAGFLRFRVDF